MTSCVATSSEGWRFQVWPQAIGYRLSFLDRQLGHIAAFGFILPVGGRYVKMDMRNLLICWQAVVLPNRKPGLFERSFNRAGTPNNRVNNGWRLSDVEIEDRLPVRGRNYKYVT